MGAELHFTININIKQCEFKQVELSICMIKLTKPLLLNRINSNNS